ncbi:amidase signature domain-containing protein [Ampelomyces quisqualis]|uniref:Glutamyl-tRNA(Gln) amidotransferase subunit A, mitochondrial n=1 Tax=Ampelomyces quisqualis TaxID=50730 RepID=A0A6A5R0P1_AMPQU|nr:amidase signature domain-containing protein [Ampelomyces quisqualis]
MSFIRYAKQYIANEAKYSNLNAFVSRIDSKVLVERAKNLQLNQNGEADPKSLYGMPIAVKDNICTKELATTAASGMLQNFHSPYDATVVKLLQDEGAMIVGKTNMDEFGMGSHSTHSHAGPVEMQRYRGERSSAGGSSGGSALAVASAQCWAALGTDTGGSVRLPAAYTGVVGFKPSYGLLSRWGVIAYANSLDTVGIMSSNAIRITQVFNPLNVYDPQDPTSLPPATRTRIEEKKKAPPPSLRIGIPLDYNIETLDPIVRHTWLRALKAMEAQGHTLHPVRLPATQHALSAYYVLAPAEASSNLAKYDGVRYGSRAEGVDGTSDSVLFAKTRGQGFGSEVQRRILLGAFSLSAQAIDNYFIQAQKVRRLVQQDFDNVFAKANPLKHQDASSGVKKGVDVLLCPTAPTLAPGSVEVENQDSLQAYMNDVFTVPASLAGLPAISVPIHIPDEERAAIHGYHEIKESAGMQLIGQYGDDHVVLSAASSLQSAMKSVQLIAYPDMTAWGHSSLGPCTTNDLKRYRQEALEHGITIAEAKERVQARIEAQAPDMARLLLHHLGARRFDAAARPHNQSREEYAARFIGEKDPIEAEELLYQNTFRVNRPDDSVNRAYANKLHRIHKALQFNSEDEQIAIDERVKASADRARKGGKRKEEENRVNNE